MWDALAALLPPLAVATVFCAVVFSVVRREMGAKRQEGRSRDNEGSAE
jgi:hypothetical protein